MDPLSKAANTAELDKMMKRPEWITCIQGPEERKSICGRNISGEFRFIDIDHAKNTVTFGSRLVPCKYCMKEVV